MTSFWLFLIVLAVICAVAAICFFYRGRWNVFPVHMKNLPGNCARGSLSIYRSTIKGIIAVATFCYLAAVGGALFIGGSAMHSRLVNSLAGVSTHGSPQPPPPTWRETSFDRIYYWVSGDNLADIAKVSYNEAREHVATVCDFGLTALALLVGVYTAIDLLKTTMEHSKDRLVKRTKVSGEADDDAKLMAHAMKHAKRVTIVAGTMDFIFSSQKLLDVLRGLHGNKALTLISTKTLQEIQAKPNGQAFWNEFKTCVRFLRAFENARCSLVEYQSGAVFIYREAIGDNQEIKYYIHEVQHGAKSRSMLGILKILTMHEAAKPHPPSQPPWDGENLLPGTAQP